MPSSVAGIGPELHPDIEPLAFLLGTWVGGGTGEYPTIASFGYREEIRFWHIGKPYIAYTHSAWGLDDGRPMHGETGFLRLPGGAVAVELVVAHPNGIAEVSVGTIDGHRLRLRSTAVTAAPTAKRHDAVARAIDVDGDVLRYTLEMAAVGQPLVIHLAATLRRRSP